MFYVKSDWFPGRTAAHAAALHGRRDVIEYLLRHGVSTDVKDMLGLTPNDYSKLLEKKTIDSETTKMNGEYRNGEHMNGNYKNGSCTIEEYKVVTKNGS